MRRPTTVPEGSAGLLTSAKSPKADIKLYCVFRLEIRMTPTFDQNISVVVSDEQDRQPCTDQTDATKHKRCPNSAATLLDLVICSPDFASSALGCNEIHR